MLLRFAAENLLSFKDAVEFNTFPSSKIQRLEWHKIKCDYASSLRLSAIYGANGAGKSNLLKCVSLLKNMVDREKLGDLGLREDLFFKLNGHGGDRPSELAMELFADGRIFYYHIVFKDMKIIEEELMLSGESSDEKIFSRKDNDIELSGKFFHDAPASIEVFMDAISRLVRTDMLLLSFLGHYYPKELPIVKTVTDWFSDLEVVVPAMNSQFVPYLLKKDAGFRDFVNSVFPEFNAGIARLEVEETEIKEDDVRANPHMQSAYLAARKNPGKPQVVGINSFNVGNLVMEDNRMRYLTIVAQHVGSSGKEIKLDMFEESDGTRRLLEYMVLFYSVLRKKKVYLVDEIERSIHPILIKNIISKISESKDAAGQLIFTTHESCLLDLDIFRPDEIWFAQKDINQSTQLYPLSDYNVHHTANIENGYLNGRYGGIPFLANLSDLKW